MSPLSLKHFLRYSANNKTYSLINLLGLVLGISSCLLIYAFVSFEVSFDDFHGDADRIYRVLGVDEAIGVSNNQVGIVMAPLGPAMENEIPQVETTVRMQGGGRVLVTVDDNAYYTQFAYSAEPSFFEVFDFQLLAGSPGDVLAEPRTAVVTETFGRTLFGGDEPVGQLVNVNNSFDLEIVGVVADPPANSHIQLDLLSSFILPSDATEQQVQARENWGFINTSTYARLAPGSSEQEVEQQITTIVGERGTMATFGATLQPLADAHLNSTDVLFEPINNSKGNRDQVFILASVALFILLIAAFNFMNLSTARSSTRAKEVGVRKINGASRWQLGLQFMLDSLLYVLTASIAALLLVFAIGPAIPFPVEIDFAAQLFPDVFAVALLILALIGLSIVAGSYPAVVLSGLPTMSVLKEKFKHSSAGRWLRWTLVVMQFTISIGIIIGMLVVNQQLDYMRSMDIGFERQGIINIRLQDPVLAENYEAFRDQLSAIPEISSLATSGGMPGLGYGRTGMLPEGGDPDDTYIMSVVSMDANYLDTMGMRLAEGRNYSEEFGSDADDAVILNQAALRALGWNSGVGRTVSIGGNDRQIVGVVEDFHFTGMRLQIEPLIMNYQEGANGFLSLRMAAGDAGTAIGRIESVWNEVYPSHPFEYSFFSEEFENLFTDDAEFSTMLFQFTFIAITVACLGLYGLASFSADQKTKEIGIRKVLGASGPTISSLILKEYCILILVANAIAWPLMYLALDNWLSGFIYRVDLDLLNFLLATVITTLIATATVSGEVFRVVRNNPVLALRYE